MKVRIEVLDAATPSGVRVVKQVNTEEELVRVGDSIIVDGVTLIGIRELGVGGSGSDPFPFDSPPSGAGGD